MTLAATAEADTVPLLSFSEGQYFLMLEMLPMTPAEGKVVTCLLVCKVN